MPYSINQLKSQMLFTSKNFVFSDFTKKKFAPGNSGANPLPPVSVYGPVLQNLFKRKLCTNLDFATSFWDRTNEFKVAFVYYVKPKETILPIWTQGLSKTIGNFGRSRFFSEKVILKRIHSAYQEG